MRTSFVLHPIAISLKFDLNRTPNDLFVVRSCYCSTFLSIARPLKEIKSPIIEVITKHHLDLPVEHKYPPTIHPTNPPNPFKIPAYVQRSALPYLGSTLDFMQISPSMQTSRKPPARAFIISKATPI